MVDLPRKKAEGTVVDADDLMVEMSATAGKIAELGTEGMSQDDKTALYHTIGLGALNTTLKVDPKKRILFDPESSVDFAGNTGPFIQYTYARIQSILQKAGDSATLAQPASMEARKRNYKTSFEYPGIKQAVNNTAQLYSELQRDLVKLFNSFYQNISILGEEDQTKEINQLAVSSQGFSSMGLPGFNYLIVCVKKTAH